MDTPIGEITRSRVIGPRGGDKTVDLRKSKGWRYFISWLRRSAGPDGWARTTQGELARVISPNVWNDTPSVDSKKTQEFRHWVRAGYVVETGERDYALNRIGKFAVGLTMKGAAACRDLGIIDAPPAVAATPPRQAAPVALPTQVAQAATTIHQAAPRSGPPLAVREARKSDLQSIRDALTLAIYALDHPPKCERTHTDDLSADELFDLAVAKAKAG